MPTFKVLNTVCKQRGEKLSAHQSQRKQKNTGLRQKNDGRREWDITNVLKRTIPAPRSFYTYLQSHYSNISDVLNTLSKGEKQSINTL